MNKAQHSYEDLQSKHAVSGLLSCVLSLLDSEAVWTLGRVRKKEVWVSIACECPCLF